MFTLLTKAEGRRLYGKLYSAWDRALLGSAFCREMDDLMCDLGEQVAGSDDA